MGARGSRDRGTSTCRSRLNRSELLNPEDHELGRLDRRDPDQTHESAVVDVVLSHRAALKTATKHPSECGGWRRRHPWTFDRGYLHVARPRRHRDAQKPQRFRPGAAVLEGSTDRDVDRDTRRQSGHFFPALVPAPNLPLAGQDVPELAHRGMDGRPVHLPWRDRGMDHVAGCALHQVADLRPGGGAGIGGLGKRAGLQGALLRGLVHSLGGHR